LTGCREWTPGDNDDDSADQYRGGGGTDRARTNDCRDAQIACALAYIDDHRAEVEIEYQQVLRDAEETRRYWEERNRDRLAAIASRPPRPEIMAMRAKLAARRAKHRQS
jgi:hypothetical protein